MPFLVVLVVVVTVILVVVVVVLTAPVVLAQTGYFIVSTVLVLVLEYEHLRLVLVQVAVMEGSVRVHDEHTRRGQRVETEEAPDVFSTAAIDQHDRPRFVALLLLPFV